MLILQVNITSMIKRRITQKLEERLEQFPVVALLGSRQVGKTTLSHIIAEEKNSIYLDLELPSDREKLSNPEIYLKAHEDKLVILDEIQRMPNIFQVLRGLVDAGIKKGITSNRFLLLGSASIELLRQSGESLAGRISYMELCTLDVLEIASKDIEKLWVRGGFPKSFLAKNDKESFIWQNSFIRTYIERDIPLFGPRIPAETLYRFWTMLCHKQGTLLNIEASFYRTSAGAEIDLIIKMPKNKLLAIEIKSSLKPKPEKGFYIACEDLKPEKSFVVYRGNERYPVAENIEAINLRDLAEELIKNNIS